MSGQQMTAIVTGDLSSNNLLVDEAGSRNPSRSSFMETDEMTGRVLNSQPEDFGAELAAAACLVVLRHGVGSRWLDLELELWRALTDAVKRRIPMLPDLAVL